VIRYHAEWVLPITAPPIRHGTVVVDGAGRIEFVGPRSEAPPGEDRELGLSALLPGLINIHSHLELTAMRGFLEDLPFAAWILRLHRAKRAVLSPTYLLDSACAGIAEGLLSGITTYSDTCDTGASFDAMLAMGVRGRMYQEVFGPDPAAWETELDALRVKIERLRPRSGDLVDVGISPHAPYTVCDPLFSAAAAYARDEQLPMAVHIAESEAERKLVCEGSGVFAEGLRARGIPVEVRADSSVRLLQRLGVLENNPLLIHCISVDDEDLRLIADSGSAVAHCPVANGKLGHGIAPAARMLDLGIPVAIGSDSVAANNRMDLLEEARVCMLLQRAHAREPVLMPARVLLDMLTVVPARILGIADRVGSLERGKDADLCAIPLDDVRAAPSIDPNDALVLSLGGSRARMVTVRGRELVRDSQLVEHSGSALADRLALIGEELQRWLDQNRSSLEQ
jgi:cytosine/adenosine deaminase-related metal-dependent hydrolase